MMPVTLPDLQPLLGLVLAHVDVRGRLLQANAGFLRLLQAPSGLDADVQAEADTGVDAVELAHLFIQPDFASLLRLCQDTDAARSWAYQGLLTFGDYVGQTRTLRAWIKPTPQGLQLLAEFDVAELERVNTTVLDLNRRHAQAQMEAAQAHFKLRQVADELTRSNAELQSLNVQLTQVHGQLLQSEKLASVGMLAAGVAHEINNPLAFVTTNVNTLGGYVGDLLRMLDADEQALSDPDPRLHADRLAQLQQDQEMAHVREDVGPLIQESLAGLTRIKDIVQALRDFALVDAPQAWQAHDLLGVLDSTVQSLWPHISQGCTLRKDYGALPPVVCVLPAMVQVFTHLLTNATQAVNGAGEVTLRSGCTGDQVWLEVADNGPGIAPEHLPRLFDPFFTTRAVGQGRGLGLAVVYGIVTRHQGHIDVNSTPGAGACFRVWLPLLQPMPTVLPSRA